MHDRQHFIKNERSFKARGIRSLQQPSVYILTILFAFGLYQVDRLYDLRNVYNQQKENVSDMQEGLKNLPEKTRDLANTAWAFGAALLILALVLAFKRVYQRRQVEEKEARIQKQEQQEYERNFHRVHKIERPTNACEKITEQEFDYQQNVTTKREIAKLVNSQAYKDAMAKKGQNQSAWNW